MFPSNKHLNSGNPSDAATFIGGMEATGGGVNKGEAVIDGLAEANKLSFRSGSKRIYILIGDDSPHGDEFLAGTTYGNGCPCGYQ